MAGTVESEMEQRISDRVLAIELEPSAQTTESGPAFAGQYQGWLRTRHLRECLWEQIQAQQIW